MNAPYLDWSVNHLPIYEYRTKVNYNKGAQVTYNDSVYESLINNNIGNLPINTACWCKLI